MKHDTSQCATYRRQDMSGGLSQKAQGVGVSEARRDGDGIDRHASHSGRRTPTDNEAYKHMSNVRLRVFPRPLRHTGVCEPAGQQSRRPRPPTRAPCASGATAPIAKGTKPPGSASSRARWPVSRGPVVWFSLNRRGARPAGRRQSDAAPVFQTEQAGCSDSCHHQILKMPQLHHAFGLTPNE
jgi:hypothetical protein